mgnify:CR=1 FL=1
MSHFYIENSQFVPIVYEDILFLCAPQHRYAIHKQMSGLDL